MPTTLAQIVTTLQDILRTDAVQAGRTTGLSGVDPNSMALASSRS
jgi:hypothetical protein